MEILMITLAVVIAAFVFFLTGAYIGSHFYCSDNEVMEPVVLRSVKRNNGEQTVNCKVQESDPVPVSSDLSDAERQRLFEEERQQLFEEDRQRKFDEDLKAFEACMNYSAEKAYDMLKGFGSD